MSRTKILIATTNVGKSREIKQLFPWNLEWLGLNEFPKLHEVEETGKTFQENATLKAVGYGQEAGVITLAEDSGLCIDALKGEPGIYSHRYGKSDEERIQKVLIALKDIPWEKRTASFVCVAVLYNPNTSEQFISEGKVEGLIATKPKGEEGFGYDPIFYFPPEQQTFAEMGARKNIYSHRRRAFEGLAPKLELQLKP